MLSRSYTRLNVLAIVCTFFSSTCSACGMNDQIPPCYISRNGEAEVITVKQPSMISYTLRLQLIAGTNFSVFALRVFGIY